MTEFFPLSALIGGSLIGLSCLILMLFNGRIAGISGIFSQLIFSKQRQKWQGLFVLGLISGPLIVYQVTNPYPIAIELSWLLIALSGFCVGFGARLGAGCTSGHGICGMGRLSRRSIIATCVFMISAVLTVFVTKHLI